MPGLEDMVDIEITKPLPSTGVIDTTYKIEGTAKAFEGVGALPWVYAEVRLKEWYKPEVAEEVSYERGFPMPITGTFSIDFKPEKEGDYQVTVLATPAPLSLPMVGVFPITGESAIMKVAVGERPPAAFRFSGVNIDGHDIALTDHDADSGLLLEKTTADYLDITPAFEWTGPTKTATISVKAGYRDWLGGFTPKTGAYTRSITLPESPDVPYSGQLDTPIRIPLTACGGLTDGAVEIVLKIAGEPDYISQIWNVYATKAPPEKYDFDLVKPTPSNANPEPGTLIDITCPVTSRCAETVDARAKVIIYEGSILPGHGDKIGEYDSGVFRIEPDESKNVIVHHTTVAGTIDRRDVQVEVYIDSDLIKESEWDDVYYVGRPPEEIIDFDLAKPSVTPAEITPGTAITITCPITSACTKQQTVTAKVIIYEGSLLPGHGSLITTKTSPAFTIAPSASYNVIAHHTAVAGTIDRRDIEVKVYIAGKLIKENEWDDVYYVKVVAPPLEPPEVETVGAENITHKSATIIGKLIDTSFWSRVEVFFKWGKTTGCTSKTGKHEMDEYDEGDEFAAELAGLEPDTRYYYKAAVDALGPRSDEVETNYGERKSFTTEAEVVRGFTMRVVNPRPAAVYWTAFFKDGTGLPDMPSLQPLDYVFEYRLSVPSERIRLGILAAGAKQDGFYPTIQYDEFDFLLRDGKNYVWDFAAHEMREE